MGYKHDLIIKAGSNNIDFVNGIAEERNSLHEGMFRNLNASSDDQILVTASPSCVEAAALAIKSQDDTSSTDQRIRRNNSDMHSATNSKRRKLSTSPLLPVHRYIVVQFIVIYHLVSFYYMLLTKRERNHYEIRFSFQNIDPNIQYI